MITKTYDACAEVRPHCCIFSHRPPHGQMVGGRQEDSYCFPWDGMFEAGISRVAEIVSFWGIQRLMMIR